MVASVKGFAAVFGVQACLNDLMQSQRVIGIKTLCRESWCRIFAFGARFNIARKGYFFE
jgi:hypothetical protein